MTHTLTKSKYVSGVDCQALLWLLVNDPEKIPELNSEIKHRMEQGTVVGELAKKLYPEGINVSTDFKENLKQTKELLKKRKPLFEAGFLHNLDEGNIFARIDILFPVGKDEWDIIEVKSGTKVKNINLHDVSFQKYICEKEGLKIRNCFLCHINNEYVKKGEIDVKEFFSIEDISEKINEDVYVGNKIKELFNVIKLKKCPKATPEEILEAEYSNVAIDEFYDSLPEENVFQLYNIRRKKAMQELYQRGIIKIKDIPSDFKLTDKQQIQRKQAGKRTHHVDNEKIKDFLESLMYPLYYLDFETFNSAIPLFDNSKPYQQIPFQFSLHVVKEKGFEPEHFSFLSEGKEDPREEFIKILKDNLGDKGSIVVYNERFEKGIIKECGEAFPDYEEWCSGIIERIVDLLHPFKNFHFYNPKQKGSASIKKVLPVFSQDVKYDDLVISSGIDASISYYKSHFEDVPAKEKKTIRESLKKYCELDTYAEVILVEKLEGLKK
tara:strand:- start:1945 stop:3426 length:1482 start_codon:yes stop_codon:yes gene_type:complete